MTYQPFVIVSHLRSGTHLLRTALESHPAIICQTEVFNSDNPQLPYPLSTPTQEILEHWVFRDVPPTIERVGFAIQAYHPWGLKAFPGIRENPAWGDIWSILEQMRELRVIHLHRDNTLRRHLSHVMARQTGNWHLWNSANVAGVTHLGAAPEPAAALPDRPIVVLDGDRLETDFEETEGLHQAVAERFRDHPLLSLSYESLSDDFDTECAGVQGFLGVERQQLTAAVTKLETRSLAESITNYASLKRRFSGTCWQHFFE